MALKANTAGRAARSKSESEVDQMLKIMLGLEAEGDHTRPFELRTRGQPLFVSIAAMDIDRRLARAAPRLRRDANEHRLPPLLTQKPRHFCHAA
jgi:hypothetical protein